MRNTFQIWASHNLEKLGDKDKVERDVGIVLMLSCTMLYSIDDMLPPGDEGSELERFRNVFKR